VSPDGKNLATSAGMLPAELRLWDMKKGERKWVADLAVGVVALAFSPDGGRLAVADGWIPGLSAGVVIFDVASGQELLRLNAVVESLAFSPDGARLWGVTPKRTLVYWDATPWPSPVNPPAVADRRSLVESLDQQDARLALKTVLRDSDPRFNGRIAILAGSPRLALAGHDGSIRLLKLPGGEMDTTLTGAEGEVKSLAASQDGRQLFAGTDRGCVFVWSNLQGLPKRVSTTNNGPVTGLAVSSDGSRAAWVTRRTSVGSGEELVAVDVVSGRRLWSSEVRAQDAQVASFSGDGKQLAVVKRKLVLLDPDGGGTLHTLAAQELSPESFPISTAMSRDGRFCAAGYFAGQRGWLIGIWDIVAGKLLRWFEGHSQTIISLAFAPDGSRLASGSIDGTARVWDVATGLELGRVRFGEPYCGLHVSISEDGQWLAAGRDGEFAIVEIPLLKP
jgi:WD40 repeat protein